MECNDYVSVNINLIIVNNRNTRKRYEICSKLTLKTPQQRHCRRSGVFIVNFERISHLFLAFQLFQLFHQFLVFQLLTLKM